MRRKNWIPVLFVLAGVVLVGIGGWQLVNGKLQTGEALKKAKAVIQAQPNPVQKESIAESKPPAVGDAIGLLDIPKIKAVLPIVEGTDPDDLAKGVGHFKGSSLPTEKGQIVLSGHRDTVFRKLGELKIGDPLNVKAKTGSQTYKITNTKIVNSDDRSIITLQKTKEELILTTCYPFGYIGNAPKRYIVYASPAN
ncbi:class D sortase [Neobacillus sp. SM06]|uniref:class D sortase n=1 Tax=Neobacillus sp. SM06 TaxID=3422492 RepID=UPI003D270AA7